MQAEIQDKTCTKIEVMTLEDEHLERAAVLFATNYQQVRRSEPLLPPCHEHAERILPRLRQLLRRGTGAAAVRDGKLVGFLLGQIMPSWQGRRTAYVPEWAHAVDNRDPSRIYQEMYALASKQWAADNSQTHLITLLADGRQTVDTFLWFGFGLMCIDAMREPCPAPDDSFGVVVRRAGPAEASVVLNLARALEDHLAAAPIFRPVEDPITEEKIVERLADPTAGIFLAGEGGELLAYVDAGPANPSAAHIIDDPKTASIRAMFTQPKCRGQGIGRRLLNQAIEWARENDYTRLAVDFEPQNVPASRFWLKHFRPVCYSMIRHIDMNNR